VGLLGVVIQPVLIVVRELHQRRGVANVQPNEIPGRRHQRQRVQDRIECWHSGHVLLDKLLSGWSTVNCATNRTSFRGLAFCIRLVPALSPASGGSPIPPGLTFSNSWGPRR